MSPMKQQLLALSAAFALGGCVSPYGWSEAPRDDRYYDVAGAPAPWWGADVASVDIFYGALGGYGNWATHSRYGRVFLPAGVGNGWQPYSRGYWRDDPRRGRMWVSSEPWGFATYHYGRWGHDSRLGWFWVPDTRFGPGWVDWRAGNGYASWAPLPPFGWSDWGYGYGNNWWVSAPGYWAYRPGNSRYVRPGRHDWQDRDRPGTTPPRARPDADTVMGNYVRNRVAPRQQVAPANGVAPQAQAAPPRNSGARPERAQGARPPRAQSPRAEASRPEAPRAEAQRPQTPRAESPRGNAPRGNPGSGSRETRGRDVSPRTQDQ